jgi:hypothetical protein
MNEIKTEIEINAMPEVVWKTLVDFNNWKNWNPIVSEVLGVPTLGSKLSVTMCGKDGKAAQKYQPIIFIFESPKSFRWRAKMGAEFLFTNDKIIELEKTIAGTRMIHRELFNGFLATLFWKQMKMFVPGMLNSMNVALKKQVEGQKLPVNKNR